MIAWLQGFVIPLTVCVSRPRGTSSWCFLLLCAHLVSDLVTGDAVRFDHLHSVFFLRRFRILARCIRCFLSCCYLRGRESHLSEFFSCLARLRYLHACLQLFPAFSPVDLLWFRPRPSRTQQCACTAVGTCSTSRGYS